MYRNGLAVGLYPSAAYILCRFLPQFVAFAIIFGVFLQMRCLFSPLKGQKPVFSVLPKYLLTEATGYCFHMGNILDGRLVVILVEETTSAILRSRSEKMCWCAIAASIVPQGNQHCEATDSMGGSHAPVSSILILQSQHILTTGGSCFPS